MKMGDRGHGAWSQRSLSKERAYLSGFEAANSLMRDSSAPALKSHEVLAVRFQFKMGVEVNRKVMSFLPRFWVLGLDGITS